MSNIEEHVSTELPIVEWVESSRADPVRYRSRQVTHVLLAAIGLTPELKDSMILKGGALMMLGYDSPRGTQDVDFSINADPEPFASNIGEILNPAMARASSQLGYVNLVTKLQKLKRRPKPSMFEEANGPALSVTIAYATRGSKDEAKLITGQAAQVLQVDLSFKEPLNNISSHNLGNTDVAIKAYSLEDLMAEKIRSLLQQVERDRFRRQDVYDICWLSENFDYSQNIKKSILDSLISKSEYKGIYPTIDSIDNPEIVKRAERDWHTLQDELPHELPSFADSFEKVRIFYVSLPWPDASDDEVTSLVPTV